MTNPATSSGPARTGLAMLPTPFEEMPRLSQALGRGGAAPSLFIKRDDCTGFAGGGNKARKLEFLVAEALQQGADVLVTVSVDVRVGPLRGRATGRARAGPVAAQSY